MLPGLDVGPGDFVYLSQEQRAHTSHLFSLLEVFTMPGSNPICPKPLSRLLTPEIWLQLSIPALPAPHVLVPMKQVNQDLDKKTNCKNKGDKSSRRQRKQDFSQP